MRKFSNLLLVLALVAATGYPAFAANQETLDVPDEGPKWSPQYEKGELVNPEPSFVPFNRQARVPQNPVITTETQVLFEEFNNWGPLGDNPPAGWTILDSGWVSTWDNNDWHLYAHSSWGDIARSYYTPTENMDEWLVSPAANFSAATTCSLIIYVYFSSTSNPGDKLSILGSTDGIIWDDVILDTQLTYGSSTKASARRAFNITDFAGGESSYYIAIRHLNPYSTLASYIYLDDVLLLKDAADSLVYQAFSGWGPFGDNPPAGWTIIDNGDYVPPPPTWDNNDWNKYYHSTWADTTARCYYSPVENQNEWLITPAMDFSSTTFDQILLRIKQAYWDDAAWLNDTGWVMVYDGFVWTAADTFTEDSPANPDYYELDITGIANGNAGVKVGLKMVGRDAAWWFVGNLEVVGLELLDHDIRTDAFLAPAMMIEGYNWDVSSRFSNIGLATESFNATYTMSSVSITPFFSEDFESGLPVTWTVIDSLNDGHTWMTGTQHDILYGSDDWRTSSWWFGEYMICDVDGAPSTTRMKEQLLTPWINCTGQSNLYLYFTHRYYGTALTQYGDVDVRIGQGDPWVNVAHYTGENIEGEGILDISAYADGQDSLQVRFYFVADAWTWYWGIDNVNIGPGTITTDYSNTQSVSNLAPLASADVVFTDFNNPDPGTYFAKTYHNLATDEDHTNDTLTSNIMCHPHVGTGGPDAGYYTWNDNINGGGPAFNWIDISTIGTPVTWNAGTGDDRWTYGINMGFGFYFYGNTFNRIFLDENGYASFDSLTTYSLSNSRIPTTLGPENQLAFLWDDLDGSVSGSAYYYTNNVDTFIVSYIDWDFYADHDQRIDAQAIITGNGKIKYQYQTVGPVIYASHSIGTENAAGDIGLSYVYDTEPMGNVANSGLAITFTYTPPEHDVTASSILSPVGYIAVGYPVVPSVVVGNLGSNTETFDVHFQINDPGGSNVYTDVQTVTGLAPLTSDTVTFDAYSIPIVGEYTCTTYTALGGDEFPGNDLITGTFDADFHYGEGGPDAGFYRWIDNFGLGAVLEDPPLYSWIDITGDGTQITTWDNGTVDDGRTNPFVMGFPNGFWYYGAYYDSIVIGTNAWVSFVRQASNYLTNYNPPSTSAPAAGIFPGWDDHDGGDFGQVWYKYDAINNRFIVSWLDWPYYLSPDGTNPHDFQIILDGNTYKIYMQFGPADLGSYQTDITVGIQDETKTIGLSYYYNDTPTMNIPYDGLAIKFYYSPPDHDVSVVSIDDPGAFLYGGQIQDIVATVANTGANTETFSVTAFDNRGYSNTQTVTNLPSLESATVTFPGWSVMACSSYTLTVYTDLAGDMVPGNDTVSTSYQSLPLANQRVQYDDGITTAGWRYNAVDFVIANKFETPYFGASISTVELMFSDDASTPGDTVQTFIFLDSDDDGIPDTIPAYVDTIVVRNKPLVTYWYVGCETTININCSSFWAGWAIKDTMANKQWMVDDVATNYYMGWVRVRASDVDPWTWSNALPYEGDQFIRAHFYGDASSQPAASVSPSSLSGQAVPGEADTASATLSNNVVVGCDLDYSVVTLQYYAGALGAADPGMPLGWTEANDKFDSDNIVAAEDGQNPMVPVYPPMTLGSGGPDGFGYTWIDSDEPGGPTFGWVDISTIGTEIVFSSDDDAYVVFPMGMAFNFYGIDFTDVTVSTNGWASLLPQSTADYTDDPIPSPTAPNALLAVYWDDLTRAYSPDTGHCYYYLNPTENQFIVSWNNWHHLGNAEQVNFQVILDADDSTIVFQYGPGLPHSTQTDYTIGIEDATGTVGLQVARNQAYVHSSLAILFDPPIQWLSTDLAPGSLAPSGSEAFDVYMSAAELDEGTYNGAVVIVSNDPDEPQLVVPVEFVVSPLGYGYLPGDANMHVGLWPPQAIGADITYVVNYLRNNPVNVPCLLDGIWLSADVNGSCAVDGSDVIRFVNYLRGVIGLTWCPGYDPLWPTPQDLPQNAPPGWPNCDNPISTGTVIPPGTTK